jgi:2-oxoglutarate dehydrogenase E1 component
MTPKSLLRHPLASSRAADLANGAFRPVLDDARASDRPGQVERIVLCSGHVWADLESDERRAQRTDLAVLRIEQLYPFPEAELSQLLENYHRAREVVWVQEEPRNMGAWPFLQRVRLPSDLRYIGRPESASPAEGWMESHLAEQRRIISEALQGVAVHAG